MEFDLQREKTSIIKVIGVGGGGSNAVNHMYMQGIKGVEFVVCNTDDQALKISPVPTKIQLGESLTHGRGAGSIPEVGKNAAIETIDELKKVLLDNTHMVFITAGMGGGTGTGAAPVIAQAARELGILTVAIVTLPFEFEGKKRKQQAAEGIEQLKKHVDSILIIRNERLREMFGNLKLSQAFSHADDVLTIAAKGIAEIITVTGHINVDFEDVKTAVKDSGNAIMGSGVAEGENRSIRAVERALASPLLNDDNIKGARYILMNISSGNKEVTMDEIGDITDYIQEQAGLTADIIWGNCFDEALDEKLSVTIIATGFKTRAEQGHEAFQRERSGTKVYVMDDETGMKKEEKSSLPVAEAPSSEPASMEPVLVVPGKNIQDTDTADQQFTFEFNVAKTSGSSTEPSNDDFAPEMQLRKETEAVSDVPDTSTEEDDQFRKSRERLMRLKSLNYRLGSGNLTELEQEPAYKRKNVKLENPQHSSESNISRYTLSTEDEKKAQIKSNNSFLHDNVD
ncbi:MAG: cell division protein FtsZ [Bacteroidota bacterium]|jgi:cell division protein FtsZ